MQAPAGAARLAAQRSAGRRAVTKRQQQESAAAFDVPTMPWEVLNPTPQQPQHHSSTHKPMSLSSPLTRAVMQRQSSAERQEQQQYAQSREVLWPSIGDQASQAQKTIETVGQAASDLQAMAMKQQRLVEQLVVYSQRVCDAAAHANAISQQAAHGALEGRQGKMFAMKASAAANAAMEALEHLLRAQEVQREVTHTTAVFAGRHSHAPLLQVGSPFPGRATSNESLPSQGKQGEKEQEQERDGHASLYDNSADADQAEWLQWQEEQPSVDSDFEMGLEYDDFSLQARNFFKRRAAKIVAKQRALANRAVLPNATSALAKKVSMMDNISYKELVEGAFENNAVPFNGPFAGVTNLRKTNTYYRSGLAVNKASKDSFMARGTMNTIMRELKTMAGSRRFGSQGLVLTQDTSFMLHCDELKPQYMKAIVTGVSNTPYSYGVFAFDIFLPNDYPKSPPKCKHVTPGATRVQGVHTPGGLSPNLHRDSGKVCLSLLGTWSGPGWRPGESSVYELLTAISFSILAAEEPYYMEPGRGGWEGTMPSTPSATAITYREEIQRGVLQYAMIGPILHATTNYFVPGQKKSVPSQALPWDSFREVLLRHFYAHRFDIVNNALEWFEATSDKYHKRALSWLIIEVISCLSLVVKKLLDKNQAQIYIKEARASIRKILFDDNMRLQMPNDDSAKRPLNRISYIQEPWKGADVAKMFEDLLHMHAEQSQIRPKPRLTAEQRRANQLLMAKRAKEQRAAAVAVAAAAASTTSEPTAEETPNAHSTPASSKKKKKSRTTKKPVQSSSASRPSRSHRSTKPKGSKKGVRTERDALNEEQGDTAMAAEKSTGTIDDVLTKYEKKQARLQERRSKMLADRKREKHRRALKRSGGYHRFEQEFHV